MQNRYIGENIRNMIDIIQYTEEEDIPALLIAVDFLKCYDQIEWVAVEGSLRFFNFSEEFVEMVKLLYKDILSCTTNNGWSSKWFSPSRGLRQGCPASPYLFLLIGEILAISVRRNGNIKGIKIGGIEKKLSQFADDTTLFTLYDSASLSSIIDTFDHFEIITGLKVNYEKTNIYRIGSLRNSVAKLYTQKDFNWTNNDIDILGILVSTNLSKIKEINIEVIFNKVKAVTQMWGNKYLSLIGKVLVVNTLVGSLYPYILSTLPSVTHDDVELFETYITCFLWNSRKPKISLKTLKCSKLCGGLKLFDLSKKDCALKISWIPRIYKNAFTNECAKYFIPMLETMGNTFWKCSIAAEDIDYIVKKTFLLEGCLKILGFIFLQDAKR